MTPYIRWYFTLATAVFGLFSYQSAFYFYLFAILILNRDYMPLSNQLTL